MGQYFISWVFLIAYVIFMLWLGLKGYKESKTIEGFFLADRKLGAWIISFSFFSTLLSTAAFLGGGGTGFLLGFGWPAYMFAFNVIFCVVPWIFIAPRMRVFTEKLKSLTIPDFFAFRYEDQTVRVIASIVILLALEFNLTAAYKASGNLLQVLLDVPYVVGILIFLVPVVIYVFIGGFKAVAWTDFIQGVLMLVGAVVLFVLVLQAVGGWSAGIAELSKIKLMGNIPGEALLKLGGFGPPPIMKAGKLTQFTLSLAFAICAANLALPHLVVRFYAAKDLNVIRKGMIITPIIIGLFVFTCYSIGPFAWLIIPKYVSGPELAKYVKDVDLVIPFLIQKLLPTGLNAFLLVAIIAAGQSTISSVIMVVVSSLSRDLIQVAKPGINEQQLLRISRWATVILGFIPFLIAIKPPAIVSMIVGQAFSVIGSAFTAPLMIGLYWRGGTAKASWISMLLATLTCIVWNFTYYPREWIYPIIPGLIVGIISYLLISWFTKKPSDKILEMIKAGV